MTGVALAALSVLLQAIVVDRSMVPLDEGHVANFAKRIVEGEVLYRDLCTGVFPGVYYIAALIFSVFGYDLIVLRLAQLVANVLTTLCLWRLSLRIAAPAYALVAPTLYAALTVLGFPIPVIFSYSALALLFALAALLTLLRYLDSLSWRDGALVGLLLAATALTKQNYGAFVGLAVLYALLDGWLSGRAGCKRPVRFLVPIVVSGALVSGVALAYFVATGAGAQLYHYTVSSLFESQMEGFNQPLPPVFGPHPSDDGRFVFLYAPGVLFNYLIRGEPLFGHTVSKAVWSGSIRVAFGATLGLLWLSPLLFAVVRNPDRIKRSDARIVWVSSVLIFLGIFPSAIWSHLVAVVPPTLVLASAFSDRVATVLKRLHTFAARAWGTVVVGALVAIIVLTARIGLDHRRWNSEPLGLARGSIHVARDQAVIYRKAVAFLEGCAEPGQTIFVAPDQPLMFFLTDRANPLPYDMEIPGPIDSDLVVERLEAEQTPCIVYNPAMYAHFSGLAEIYPKIEAYFKTAYEVREEIREGPYQWQGLVRRSVPASAH